MAKNDQYTPTKKVVDWFKQNSTYFTEETFASDVAIEKFTNGEHLPFRLDEKCKYGIWFKDADIPISFSTFERAEDFQLYWRRINNHANATEFRIRQPSAIDLLKNKIKERREELRTLEMQLEQLQDAKMRREFPEEFLDDVDEAFNELAKTRK